ncbi:hypothetical protein H632_c35p0, partial [Helicosporidium sp. ATCC 50920]
MRQLRFGACIAASLLFSLSLAWAKNGARTFLADAQGETDVEAPGYPYVLTNATIPTILRRVATAKNEVVFTTLVLKKGEDLTGFNMQMLSTFCYWLDRVNALEHTLIITTDVKSHLLIR